MSKFSVKFTIRKNGSRVSNGILVYDGVNTSLPTWPDHLDRDGYAQTYWHSDWNGKEVDVSCHTDGVESGTAARVGRITLRPGAVFDLNI